MDDKIKKGVRADGSDDPDGLENRPNGWQPPKPKIMLRKVEQPVEQPEQSIEPPAQLRGR